MNEDKKLICPIKRKQSLSIKIDENPDSTINIKANIRVGNPLHALINFINKKGERKC